MVFHVIYLFIYLHNYLFVIIIFIFKQKNKSQEYIFNNDHNYVKGSLKYYYDNDTDVIVTGDRDNSDEIPEITDPSFKIDGLTELTKLYI